MPSEFALVKWYMDCVTERGDLALVYCAELRWRGIRASYSSVLTVREASTESRSSMGSYRLSATSGQISVEIPRLRVSGIWKADAAPAERIVYENAGGRAHWNCLQPRSLVDLRIGEREFSGLGYAECLTLTVPPWQLPMRELRWGRFVSPEDALAWVDWKGEYATSFAIHNGQACETLTVSDSEVVTRGGSLRMAESFSIRAGRVGSTVLPGAPALGKLLPRSLFNIEEQKWRSRGAFTEGDRSSHGWVIHEVVHWKV
jgi:hypothetical protein